MELAWAPQYVRPDRVRHDLEGHQYVLTRAHEALAAWRGAVHVVGPPPMVARRAFDVEILRFASSFASPIQTSAEFWQNINYVYPIFPSPKP